MTSFRYTEMWTVMVNDFRRNFPVLLRLMSSASKSQKVVHDTTFRDYDAISWMMNYLRHCGHFHVPITESKVLKLLGKFVTSGIIKPVEVSKNSTDKSECFTKNGSKYIFIEEPSEPDFSDVDEMHRFQHLEVCDETASCKSSSSSDYGDDSQPNTSSIRENSLKTDSTSHYERFPLSSSDNTESSVEDSQPVACPPSSVPKTTLKAADSPSKISPLHLNVIVSPNGRVKRRLSVLEEMAISEDKSRFVECMNAVHQEFSKQHKHPAQPLFGGLTDIPESNMSQQSENLSVNDTHPTPLTRTWSSRRIVKKMDKENIPVTISSSKDDKMDPHASSMSHHKDVAVSTVDTPVKDEKIEKLRALRNDVWRRQIRKNFRTNLCITNEELDRFIPNVNMLIHSYPTLSYKMKSSIEVLDYRNIRHNLMYVTPVGLNIEVDANKDLPRGIYNNMLLMKKWESLPRDPCQPSENRWEDAIMQMICDYFTKECGPLIPKELHSIFIMGSAFLHQLYTCESPSPCRGQQGVSQQFGEHSFSSPARFRNPSADASVPLTEKSSLFNLISVKRQMTEPLPDANFNYKAEKLYNDGQEPEHQLRASMRDYSRFIGDMWSDTDNCFPRRWCSQSLCDVKVATLVKNITENVVPNTLLLSTLATTHRSSLVTNTEMAESASLSTTVPTTPHFNRYAAACHSTPQTIAFRHYQDEEEPPVNCDGGGESVNEHISVGPDSCLSNHFVASQSSTDEASDELSNLQLNANSVTPFSRSCIGPRENREEWESRSLTQAWKDHLRTCCLLLKPESRRHLMLLLQFLRDVVYNPHIRMTLNPRHNNLSSQILDMFVGAVFPELQLDQLGQEFPLGINPAASYAQLYEELQRLHNRHRLTLAFMILHYRSIMRPSHTTRRCILREVTEICCPSLNFEFCVSIRHPVSEINKIVMNYTQDALVKVVQDIVESTTLGRKQKLIQLDRCKEVHPAAYWAVMKDVATEQRIRLNLQSSHEGSRVRQGAKLVQNFLSRFKKH